MSEVIDIMFWLGNGLMILIAAAVAATGIPVDPAVSLATLMVADFVAGVFKARVIGEPVTSHRLKVGVLVKCSVMLIPFSLAIAAKGIGVDFEPYLKWAISMLILSETYSICANAYTIKTGKTLPEWEVISIIMHKMRSLIDVIDKR